MTGSSNHPDPKKPAEGLPRDAAHWAMLSRRLHVAEVPSGAISLNVEGRRAVSPLQGFGAMWQKTYRVRLVGASATPSEVVKAWRQDFPKFWGARGNRFYAPISGLAPGDVVLINSPVPRLMSTGIVVLYADDESFSFMTPQGHPFSGWVTFSAFEEEEVTVAQVQVLMRPNDPLWELAMPLGFSKAEDNIWLRTLGSLAAHFGVEEQVQMKAVVLDRRRQWEQARNIRDNAVLRSVLHTVATSASRVHVLIRRRALRRVSPGGSGSGP